MVLTHTMYTYLLETYRLDVNGEIVAVHAHRFKDVFKMFPDGIPTNELHADRCVCISSRGVVTSDIKF